jgi:hypothetical protein
MLSRFLGEAAEITGDARLRESAGEFQRIGDAWEDLGEWFRVTSEAPEPAALLGDCSDPLHRLADMEETAWGKLRATLD